MATENAKQEGKNTGISMLLANNAIFLPFLGLLLLFMAVWPQKIKDYPQFIDWQTIQNLTGLLLMVTAIKQSAVVGRYSRKWLIKTRTERGLAFALVALSGVLSMFLTNDIALFVTIPLTLGFRDVIENDVKKLIIFQAMAVNVGSALSPVGNPQNLFLWHRWGLSFLGFTARMFPLFMVLFTVLLLFVRIVFPAKKLTFYSNVSKVEMNIRLFIFSFVLLVGFVVAIECGKALYVFVGIVLLYLLFYRNVFLKTDWALLLLFAVMFVDFHLLSQVPFVARFVQHFDMDTAENTFVSGLLYSQVMSNVPAAIFVSKFSHQWQAIAYGVNVGGNGLVWASLANIIALRFVKRRSVWIDFHKYSLLYLAVTAVLVWLLFYVL
jgi:Na+/H+ antiporter NhaD/arsenite permease-like protein